MLIFWINDIVHPSKSWLTKLKRSQPNTTLSKKQHNIWAQFSDCVHQTVHEYVPTNGETYARSHTGGLGTTEVFSHKIYLAAKV